MKGNKYRKYKNGTADKLTDIKLSQEITGQMIIMEIACSKFTMNKKISKSLIIESIRYQLLSCGNNWYEYHSDHMMDNSELDMSVEEQYLAAIPIAQEMFPSFFIITEHMKSQGVTEIITDFT